MIENKDTVLRNASIGDAENLAVLENIASRGLSLWFWNKAVISGKAKDPWEFGIEEMANPMAQCGYKNAVVAVTNKEISGAATGYIMPPMPKDGAFDPVLVPLFELFSQAEGQWLIDSIAVQPEYHGQGIGATLVDDCFKRARKSGANTINLVVEDSNQVAIKLYQSREFEEITRRKYIPFTDEQTTQNWLLLSANLN